MPGKLFIVATPIGNVQDITLRALDILRQVDGIICEEERQGSTLLKRLMISPNELLTLNEHNEDDQTNALITRLRQGQSLALISDCGTPAFADPGARLISEALQFKIQVTTIPGPSSLMAAISLSPIPLKEFMFVGFLPRKDPERITKLEYLRSLRVPLIILDTPYRLVKLMDEVQKVFGPKKLVTLGLDLTLPSEWVVHNTVHWIRQNIPVKKGEFVLIIHR